MLFRIARRLPDDESGIVSWFGRNEEGLLICLLVTAAFSDLYLGVDLQTESSHLDKLLPSEKKGPSDSRAPQDALSA